MTYVVVENCIKCKYLDCVEVCPVECIDCGVCEPECPAEAIKPDTEPDLAVWLKLNAEYAKSWPNITSKKEPPPDGKDFDGRPNKFEEFFSPTPGEGD